MKNTKFLILLAVIISVVSITAACASADTETGYYKNQTVKAEILEINGTELYLEVDTLLASLNNNILNGAVQVTPNGNNNIQLSTDKDGKPTYNYYTNVQYATGNFGSITFGSADVNIQSAVHTFVVINGSAPKNITVTVTPEMLAGLDVGNTVNVTFDEKGKVTRIEKAELQENNSMKDEKTEKDN